MNKLISLQLDEELLEKLRLVCKTEDRSMSSIIRRAIKQYIDKSE